MITYTPKQYYNDSILFLNTNVFSLKFFFFFAFNTSNHNVLSNANAEKLENKPRDLNRSN